MISLLGYFRIAVEALFKSQIFARPLQNALPRTINVEFIRAPLTRRSMARLSRRNELDDNTGGPMSAKRPGQRRASIRIAASRRKKGRRRCVFRKQTRVTGTAGSCGHPLRRAFCEIPHQELRQRAESWRTTPCSAGNCRPSQGQTHALQVIGTTLTGSAPCAR